MALQIRRGLDSDLPPAPDGELLFATDTEKLYIGNNGGHVLVGPTAGGGGGGSGTVDSASTVTLITDTVDSAYVQGRVDFEGTVDSAYVQARQSQTSSAFDSAASIALTIETVDSAYVNALVTIPPGFDSADAISAVTSSDLDMDGKRVLFANVYSTEGDLPSASDNHGMFAHVHGTGAGYFAHAGNWVRLANSSEIVSAPVSSVNTKTGAVVLDASDVGALPSSTSYVSTVNGSSGAVVLDHTDVGAQVAGSYLTSVDGNNDTILLQRATSVPTAGSLTAGEIALDTSTGKLYTKTTGGVVVEVGGGGSSGANTMKPHAQPLEWTTTGGYTFRHKSRSSGPTSSITMNRNRLNAYSSITGTGSGANWLPQATTVMTLNVPAGSKFLFFGFNTDSGTANSLKIAMDSIYMDSIQLYSFGSNNLLFADGINAYSWPGHSPQSNTDWQYQQNFSQTPWEISSQLKFTAQVTSSTTGLNILGYFQPAD